MILFVRRSGQAVIYKSATILTTISVARIITNLIEVWLGHFI
jgi:hypothetical protein